MALKLSAWDLSPIKPSDIERAMKSIESKTADLVKKRSLLTDKISEKEFLKIVKELEKLRIETEKLGAYSHLKFCEDTTNQKANAVQSKVRTFLTKIGNQLLFFSLWFKDLPEAKAQQLISSSGPYQYHFALIRKMKPYTLNEKEEKLINIKDANGISSLINVYDIFTSQFTYNFQGKERTQEEMINFVRSSSPETRKEAYNTILAPYKANRNVIGEIYKSIVNDWREENVHIRGYKHPIGVRNFANDVPDEAVDVLLKVCEKNQDKFQRFFELKRKKLGLKKLNRYDLYSPLAEENKSIPYPEAINLVMDTFNGFSKEFAGAAKKIIEANHIHSLVQKGKRSGAFCASASIEIPPYILMSYTNKYRDVFTLAHELGHGVHYVLSSKQTEFTQDACLPLAETASIFSEMLLSEKLIKENKEVARNMIFAKLDDIYASIIRQAGFVNFERKAHWMMEEGRTIDEISLVYLTDLRKQLGSKIKVDEIFSYEWAYIPHIFHTPFYCYAYAFGNLLTLALYEMYKEDGSRFVAKYIDMLSKGGSESPIEITKVMGIDICSEEFWQKGFDAIEGMIKKIE